VSTRHTDTTDIRAWLRENRPDLGVQPRGAIKASALAEYRAANPDDVSREPSAELDGSVADVSREPFAELENGETAPEAPAGRWKWSKRAAPKMRRTVHRRVPIDGLASMVWAGIGRLLATDELLPVARCMQLQAPAAGAVLDDALRGSVVDRMAQPIARASKRGEAVFGAAGPPILVAVVCKRPELYPVVKPMLVEALKSWIVISGPKIRRMREKEQRLLAELAEDGLDVKSIEDMIDKLFAPEAPAEDQDAAEPARVAA
jgi:hypothetical protein